MSNGALKKDVNFLFSKAENIFGKHCRNLQCNDVDIVFSILPSSYLMKVYVSKNTEMTVPIRKQIAHIGGNSDMLLDSHLEDVTTRYLPL